MQVRILFIWGAYMRFRAVLFDMDGVLVDSEPGYNEAEAKFFSLLNLPFGKREIACHHGRKRRRGGTHRQGLVSGTCADD